MNIFAIKKRLSHGLNTCGKFLHPTGERPKVAVANEDVPVRPIRDDLFHGASCWQVNAAGVRSVNGRGR